MRKSIEKIFIVIVIVSLAFGIIGLNYSYAGEATISVGAAKPGQDFNITINMPGDAVAYEFNLEVTFADNSKQSTKEADASTSLGSIGNKTLTFKAPVAGNAKVRVTNLIISDKSGNKINSQSTLEQGFSVKTGDTVYALEKLNVRKSASTSGEKLGALKKDDKTVRISVGANGWDKINFNGGTGYVMSKYLTTKSPEDRAKEEPKWTDTNDTVYSLADLNVREGWGTSYKTVGGLSIGDSVKRLATGENGWDKIEYEGKTAYVTSKYLTTSKAEADKKLESLEENTVNEVDETNTVDNNTVADTNIVGDPDVYNTIVDEIGVLPQVGTSTGSYIYYISIVIAIIMVSVAELFVLVTSEYFVVPFEVFVFDCTTFTVPSHSRHQLELLIPPV